MISMVGLRKFRLKIANNFSPTGLMSWCDWTTVELTAEYFNLNAKFLSVFLQFLDS